nr:plasmid mobilization relaxosome protein MobC [Sporosarcina sp. BP05]
MVNRKESRQVNFRVNDLEYERLEQMAKIVGMTVPNFCKKKAQGAKMRSPQIDGDGAKEISRQLRAIGSNVNQLAKGVNAGNSDSDVELRAINGDLQAINKELEAIWQLFSEALQK